MGTEIIIQCATNGYTPNKQLRFHSQVPAHDREDTALSHFHKPLKDTT